MIFLTFTWQPRRLESALQGVNVQVGAVAGGSGGGAARHDEAGGAGQLASRARAGAKTTAGWLGILGGAAHNNGKLWHKSQAILHSWKVQIAWFWPTTFVLWFAVQVLSFYWVVICCSLVPLKFIPIMTTPHFVNKWFYVTKVLMYFVFNIWLVKL